MSTAVYAARRVRDSGGGWCDPLQLGHLQARAAKSQAAQTQGHKTTMRRPHPRVVSPAHLRPSASSTARTQRPRAQPPGAGSASPRCCEPRTRFAHRSQGPCAPLSKRLRDRHPHGAWHRSNFGQSPDRCKPVPGGGGERDIDRTASIGLITTGKTAGTVDISASLIARNGGIDA